MTDLNDISLSLCRYFEASLIFQSVFVLDNFLYLMSLCLLNCLFSNTYKKCLDLDKVLFNVFLTLAEFFMYSCHISLNNSSALCLAGMANLLRIRSACIATFKYSLKLYAFLYVKFVKFYQKWLKCQEIFLRRGCSERLICCGFDWLRGQDSNLRPLGYEPNELPDCSTPL